MLGIALLCAKMGKPEVLPKARARQATPPAGADTGRKDYLQRLGIQKNANSSFVPSNDHKTKDQSEIKGKMPSSFVNVPSHHETTSQSSTPSVFSSASEESEDEMDAQMKCLDLKGQDDFRISFLRKLSYEKVWVPPIQRPPKSQTVIIFDWDDTLLCTSYLVQNDAAGRHDVSGRPLPPAIQEQLRCIEKRAKEILELSLRLGQTYIITNAMQGWVEYSAAKYVPGLLSVLQRVPVISARSKYESRYPRDVSMWKINAFRDLQRELDLPVVTNLISVGDSNYEMDATQVMGKEFSEALVKTIKLRDNPSPEELLKQLDLVAQNFERIVTNARNLKIGLERK